MSGEVHSLLRQLLDAYSARTDELAPTVSLLRASSSLRAFASASFATGAADVARRLGMLERPELTSSQSPAAAAASSGGSGGGSGAFSRSPAAATLHEIGEDPHSPYE